MSTLNRKAIIAKIHIAKSDLGLDNETYMQMLQSLTHKSSCSMMTDGELVVVYNAMKKRGFVPKATQFKRQNRPAPTANKALYLAKITALLMQYQLPQSYADRMAQRAFGVDFAHWLDVTQLKKLIQMLEVYVRRQNKKHG